MRRSNPNSSPPMTRMAVAPVNPTVRTPNASPLRRMRARCRSKARAEWSGCAGSRAARERSMARKRRFCAKFRNTLVPEIMNAGASVAWMTSTAGGRTTTHPALPPDMRTPSQRKGRGEERLGAGSDAGALREVRGLDDQGAVADTSLRGGHAADVARELGVDLNQVDARADVGQDPVEGVGRAGAQELRDGGVLVVEAAGLLVVR